MASLFRKSTKLVFDEQEVTVKELGVDVLIQAEYGEVKLTDEQLIKECTGLNKADLGKDAYLAIMNAIDALHDGVFQKSDNTKENGVKKKQQLWSHV